MQSLQNQNEYLGNNNQNLDMENLNSMMKNLNLEITIRIKLEMKALTLLGKIWEIAIKLILI